ncbi:MAG: hypothetical protein EOP51_11840 [Sphingobacteriales bacterium]|nr:MAG: hypothetical protein EOP51_11840 [Sphingobacteriales bacterium]
MKVSKAEKETLIHAIGQWELNGNIDTYKAAELRQTIDLKTSPAQQIAQYFFIIAISCIMLAFGTIFIDEKLLEKIKSYFSLSNIFIAVSFLGMSIGWFWYCKKKLHNKTSLAYEANMVLGALLLLVALVYACKDVGFGAGHSGFLLAVAALFAILSGYLRSRALWIGFILGIMGWYGSFSNAHSLNNLFLHMNYPVRFAIFGLLITGFSLLQKHIKPIAFMHRVTYVTGLLILFTALWGVSVFGNYAYLDEWAKVRQTQVIAYAVAFGFVCLATIYIGIKKNDDLTRDFGLIFLLINLYTRYFEYFWDGMNKGIFFIILAVSFWIIGRLIERRRKSKVHGVLL